MPGHIINRVAWREGPAPGPTAAQAAAAGTAPGAAAAAPAGEEGRLEVRYCDAFDGGRVLLPQSVRCAPGGGRVSRWRVGLTGSIAACKGRAEAA
jgi:hypothetical protein